MTILFFAQLVDATGCSKVEWPDAGTINSDALWDRLLREYPALANHRPSVRLARNGAYTTPGQVFQPGDEVALIPPVSGG
jgi:molybdopterin converting factor small subunit